MDYTLYISLINTHRECNSAAKYFYLVVAKLLLNVGSLILAFASVIGGSRNSLLVKESRYLFTG